MHFVAIYTLAFFGQKTRGRHGLTCIVVLEQKCDRVSPSMLRVCER